MGAVGHPCPPEILVPDAGGFDLGLNIDGVKGDAGAYPTDNTAVADAGPESPPVTDSGVNDGAIDAGMTLIDSGVAGNDAGEVSNTAPYDAGMSLVDAGVDAGVPECESCDDCDSEKSVLR